MDRHPLVSGKADSVRKFDIIPYTLHFIGQKLHLV